MRGKEVGYFYRVASMNQRTLLDKYWN